VLLAAFAALCAAALCCVDVDCAKYPPAGGPAARVPLVFVPGFTGSRLVAPDGADAYLTPWQALGLAPRDLSLPLAWSATVDAGAPADATGFTQGRDALAAAGPLAAVTLASCIRVAVYSRPLSYLARCPGRPFYAWGYDWRRDNLENAAALADFVRGVAARHNSTVQLLGHSNGGVLSRVVAARFAEDAAAGRGRQLVHSTVYAGVPFGGGLGTLADFTAGITLGLSDTKSLAADRALSISSVYTYLPLTAADAADAASSSFALDAVSGAVVPLNVSDVATWAALGIAPAASGAPGSAGWHHIRAALARAAIVRGYFRPNPAAGPPPPAVVIASRAWSVAKNYTLRRGPAWPALAGAALDFAAFTTAPGDGSVRWDAAMPFAPFVAPVVEPAPALRHSYLLDDIDALHRALNQVPY